jgi:thiol-disulfide isomerase/thioredoxin
MSLFGRQSDATLPSEGHLPGFDGATGWLNSTPLGAADLRGKVVLVDFGTFTCINWLRTLPYIRAWAEKYRELGLVLIGVQTPEFEIEHDVESVRRSLQEMRIEHPVAIDNDYAVWDAFANRYWPALYLADQEGALRYHHFGEGRYEESERAIQELLGEHDDLVSVEGTGIEAPAAWDDVQSPETYVGYGRAERFASSGDGVANERRAYDVPEVLRPNQWALGGEWTIRRESAVVHEAGGRIAFRFHARDLHLVLAPEHEGTPVRFRVLLDGQPPGDSHGDDIDEQGGGTVSAVRLYQLVRQAGRVSDRTFEITFLDPGAQALVFTFG